MAQHLLSVLSPAIPLSPSSSRFRSILLALQYCFQVASTCLRPLVARPFSPDQISCYCKQPFYWICIPVFELDHSRHPDTRRADLRPAVAANASQAGHQQNLSLTPPVACLSYFATALEPFNSARGAFLVPRHWWGYRRRGITSRSGPSLMSQAVDAQETASLHPHSAGPPRVILGRPLPSTVVPWPILA